MLLASHLNQREKDVLASLVYEYIGSGQPAGSRTLSKRYRLGVSSATIRNTMTDLEEMGLVYQPHTSAGRLPTDMGIRVFVDTMMAVKALNQNERDFIINRFEDLSREGDLWVRTVHLLSELTEQAAIVISPRPDSMVLRHVRFVPLTDGEVLAVLVGNSGVTQSRLLRVDIDLSASRLERVHNYLNELVPGRTLAEARHILEQEAKESRRTMDRFRSEALVLGQGALETHDSDPEVVVHGQSKLVMSPAFADLERLQQLMGLLEDQDRLVKLLDAMMHSDGPTVVIGAEHPMTDLAACSVISASYRRGPMALGTLGVIGPRSMDYGRVVSLVGYTAELLSGSN
jgi:heat-inducible transcriptional repressor